MSNSKIVSLVVGATVLLLIGGVVLASRAPSPPRIETTAQAQAEIQESTHDWGTITLTGGVVHKSFMIKNSGSSPLQLANIKTSCMCTEAKVIINGQQSPYFGMHSNSSWLGELEPGQEAELVVTFDPAFHGPSGTGQITRIVSVETNDQNNSNLEFSLSANVIN